MVLLFLAASLPTWVAANPMVGSWKCIPAHFTNQLYPRQELHLTYNEGQRFEGEILLRKPHDDRTFTYVLAVTGRWQYRGGTLKHFDSQTRIVRVLHGREDISDSAWAQEILNDPARGQFDQEFNTRTSGYRKLKMIGVDTDLTCHRNTPENG